LTINLPRLRKDVEDLARIGTDPLGGVTRPSFSPADLEARDWLRERIEAAGLAYRVDGAGNQFGRLEGSAAGRT
jgi:N-carbamoyl-L-amino-acid hydrolase